MSMLPQAEFSICGSKMVKLMFSIAGKPLKEAIPGSSFFPMYCDYHAKDENIKVFLTWSQGRCC